MVSSAVLAASERNIRRNIYGCQNRNEYWGGLPVVILFGDDYQFPPVMAPGAITGYGLRIGLKPDKDSKYTLDE